MEQLRQRDDLTPTQTLKLLAIFEKIYESLYFPEEAEGHTDDYNPYDIPMAKEPLEYHEDSEDSGTGTKKGWHIPKEEITGIR